MSEADKECSKSRYAEENQRKGKGKQKEKEQIKSSSRYADENHKKGKSNQKKKEPVKSGSRYAQEDQKKRNKQSDSQSGASAGLARSGSRYDASGHNMYEKEVKTGSRYAADTHGKNAGKRQGIKAAEKTAHKNAGFAKNVNQHKQGKPALTGSSGDSMSGQGVASHGALAQETASQATSARSAASQATSARSAASQATSAQGMASRGLIAAAAESAGLGLRDRIRGVHPLKLAGAALGGVVLIAYLIVAVYFGKHFYSGMTIYGIDCTYQTAEQVREAINARIGQYRLSVSERGDLHDEITAGQIELAYEDDHAIEQELKDQRSYIWPIMLLIKDNEGPEINTVYNKVGFDAVMDQMNAFLPENVVAPQDAYRGETEDAYEVVPEVMGTTLDREKTKDVLLTALDLGVDQISLEDTGCYIDPEIYQDNEELNTEVEKLNSLITARITYDFGDRQEVVDGSVMKEWIACDEEGEYYLDDNQIWAYVDTLAEKYDTFGGDRTFYTSVGTTVELSGGDYGWMIDRDDTAWLLSQDVKAGKVETITPQYYYTAQSRDENDIGGTYVEVCISLQEMWCYQDGELIVDTPVVTGNPNKNNATPAGGVWAIDGKMTDYILRGEGYATPVSYWMPFNGNVGIHDLQSRAYFGGTIYLYNGSHGCVNTPLDAVKLIFHTVSIGTPVIVYP